MVRSLNGRTSTSRHVTDYPILSCLSSRARMNPKININRCATHKHALALTRTATFAFFPDRSLSSCNARLYRPPSVALTLFSKTSSALFRVEPCKGCSSRGPESGTSRLITHRPHAPWSPCRRASGPGQPFVSASSLICV